MSQRLHIGKTNDNLYDCVIEKIDHNTFNRLRIEWLAMEWLTENSRIYLSPFKIRIGDMDLYHEMEPILEELFESLERKYPDDVWFFYAGPHEIEHPTRKALVSWIGSVKKTSKTP